MTQDDLKQKVRRIIITQYENYRDGPAPDITGATTLVDDLAFDSLDLVEIGMDLEDALDIELDDDAAAQLITVGDLVNHLAERLSVGA